MQLNRLVSGLIVAAFVALIAVAAYAVWSSTQTGHGSSRVGQAGTFSVSAGPAPGAPGGPPPSEMIAGPGGSGSAGVNITSTSPLALTLTSYNAVGTLTISNAGPLCTAANFTLNTTPQTAAITIAPNATTLVDLKNIVSLNSNAPIDCAGANLDYVVSVTASQGS